MEIPLILQCVRYRYRQDFGKPPDFEASALREKKAGAEGQWPATPAVVSY